MSEAFTCDRCGLIKGGNSTARFSSGFIPYEVMAPGTGDGGPIRPMDLCKRCWDDWLYWLKTIDEAES